MCVFIFVLNLSVIMYLSFFVGAVAEPLTITTAEVVSGLTWLNSTRCSGNEKRLIDCTNLEHQFQKCSSTEYAGVKCGSQKGKTIENDLSLPCYVSGLCYREPYPCS